MYVRRVTHAQFSDLVKFRGRGDTIFVRQNGRILFNLFPTYKLLLSSNEKKSYHFFDDRAAVGWWRLILKALTFDWLTMNFKLEHQSCVKI